MTNEQPKAVVGFVYDNDVEMRPRVDVRRMERARRVQSIHADGLRLVVKNANGYVEAALRGDGAVVRVGA